MPVDRIRECIEIARREKNLYRVIDLPKRARYGFLHVNAYPRPPCSALFVHSWYRYARVKKTQAHPHHTHGGFFFPVKIFSLVTFPSIANVSRDIVDRSSSTFTGRYISVTPKDFSSYGLTISPNVRQQQLLEIWTYISKLSPSLVELYSVEIDCALIQNKFTSRSVPQENKFIYEDCKSGNCDYSLLW